MKKTATLLFVLLLSFCMILFASATETTVYLDGTGATVDAETDFATAFAALSDGGTLVVCGDTTFGTKDKGVTLPAVGGKVTITGQKDATLTMARSLTLNSEVEFKDINFCSAHASNGNIIAKGNHITFGENVNVTASGGRYPTIIGGAADGTLTSDSHVTVKSGTFLAVYGGNFAGTFNGNSLVEVLGGTITSAVVGGNLNGNFKGSSTVNIGGNAEIQHNENTKVGIVGGTMGSSSATATAYTFEGDITVNYFGNAQIYANSYTVSRYKNITTMGNVTFTASENATINRHTYVGGYYGNLDGDVKVILKGNAQVKGSRFVCAGAFEGDVDGNCSVEIYDNVSVTGAVFSGCYNGDVSGNTSLTMNGGKVTSTFTSASRTGSVSGTQSILLKNGTVGPVKGDATIDLAKDASVTITSCSGIITTTTIDGYKVVATDNGTTTTYTSVPFVASDIVYVDGTGATAGAFTSLAEALIATGGNTVIISGNTTVSEPFTFYEKEKDIVITSKNGALLTLSANITLPKNTNGTSVTFDLPIKANAAKIFGGFRNVTFTENFTVDGNLDFYGGVDATALTVNADAITEKEYAITVKNGTFDNFAAGNLRAEYNNCVGSLAAPVTVTVNGGTFNSSFSVSGMSILADNAALTISDGVFNCPIYVQGGMSAVIAKGVKASDTVASDRKYYAIDGDITVDISGGIFNGGMISAYEAQVAYTQVMRGNYTVSIMGGTFADGTVLDATQVKAYADSDKCATLTYADSYEFATKLFDTVSGVEQNDTEPIRIAFIGDSITEGYTVAAENVDRLTQSYPALVADLAKAAGRDVVASNYGISSAGILKATAYYYPNYLAYPMLLEETDADYIVIALGTNDSFAGGTTGAQIEFETNYRNLIETVGALNETDKVFITNALNRDNEGLGQIRVASVVRPTQERIAKELASESDKYVFVDLYRLTMEEAAAGTLLSTDNLHPSKAGFEKMADVLYGVMFENKAATTTSYKSNDIYVSASGSEFGSGTASDHVSRLDIAFAMLPEGEEATIHIIGNVAYSASIFIPITPKKLTIVGEESGATLQNGSTSFKIGCDVKFDNLTLATTAVTEFYGCYNDVEMTDSVTLNGDWSFFAGHNIYREGAAYSANDTVESASDADDCNIVLNCAGTFTNFALGNRRCQGLAPFGTYSGNLTAYIGENVRISGTDYVGVVGQNYLTGTISAEIPTTLTLAEYAPTHTVTSPIVYDATKNTGTVTVNTYEPTPAVAVAYVDGTGKTEGAYTDLASAALALRDGGTIVICGDTSITAQTVLPKGIKLTITAQNNAVLHLGARLTLGGETTFDNITINNASTSYRLIVAAGNPVTMGEGVVTTTNGTDLVYPAIIGGNYDTACTTGSHITVKGGTWRNIYGANYNGTFTGDSTVDFMGGTVLVTLSGGSYSGNYEGNATLNISGNATVEYNTIGGNALGVIGGNVGANNGTARTFNGTININIGGNAVINSLILGTSRFNNITTTADVSIDIFGNAHINRNIYAGGWLGQTTTKNGITLTLRENSTYTNPNGSVYICAGAQSGTVTGDVKVVVKDNANVAGNIYGGGYSGSVVGNSVAEIYGGTVTTSFTAGSRSGNVSGDTVVNAYGGKIGYYSSVSVYGICGNGGDNGTVSGKAYITVDGADIAGAVEARTENYDITLKSGKIGNAPDTVKVDLSNNASLSVGGSITASRVIGGGIITLPASGSIVTDAMSGEVTLLIDGTPEHNQTYITVNDVDTNATVNYTPVDTDVLNKVVGDTAVTYTLRYTDRFDSTHVKVYYYNPLENAEKQPNIVMVKGLASEDDRVSVTLTKTTEDGRGVAEADVDPGLYYYKVYYGSGGSDYEIKYFYVSGKTESLNFECPLEPYVEDSYMENLYSNQTDEVMAFFGTQDLVGYTKPETFEYHENERAFLTNADVCDYIAKLDEESEYLYTFYPFETSAKGNEWPVMVFTKDTVAEGASFDEVAAAIRAAGEREILMITAGVHGNEPAGPEGALFLASELSGDYGEEVLDHFGAIVIMPVVSIDNLQRFKRMTEDGINPNRDLMALYLPSSKHQIYVYKSFMPTITIDCHEDSGNLTVDGTDYSIENLDDVCIRYSGLQNSPLHNVTAISNGTESIAEQKGMQIMVDAIERTRNSGVRSSVYYSATCNPVTSTDYPSARGSYGFIVETMRIWSGKERYERAVFAMKEALKSLIAEFIEEDGALAKSVYENRARVAAITDFDENNLFATKTTVSGNTTISMPRPTIYVDGTYKDENNTKNFSFFDTVSKLRALPTAYVVSADAENLDKILNLLDMHGISYSRLCEGATLTLRKYEGIGSAVSLADAAEVTFENGAYVVTMNTSDAYLAAYLFEPDSFPFTSAENTTVSMAHMGYITEGDLYRAETDDMPTVIANMTYIEGDINNDRKVDISDVMQALRTCINEDGKLIDVLKILKLAVK